MQLNGVTDSSMAFPGRGDAAGTFSTGAFSSMHCTPCPITPGLVTPKLGDAGVQLKLKSEQQLSAAGSAGGKPDGSREEASVKLKAEVKAEVKTEVKTEEPFSSVRGVEASSLLVPRHPEVRT